MKIVMLVVSLFLIVGCSPAPVPADAVKECLDKNWEAHYRSTASVVEFDCVPPDEFKPTISSSNGELKEN